MPLHKIEWFGPASGIGLWHLTEAEEVLVQKVGDVPPADLAHPNKRKEWLAGRALLRHLIDECKLPWQGLRKDDSGKPFLIGLPHAISISNSFPWVAVQLHPTGSVGIDLEQVRPSLAVVMPRILQASEFEDGKESLEKLSVYWCTKEALFKWYGRRDVLFTHHLRVAPFQYAQRGQVQGEVLAPQGVLNVTLQYERFGDWMLVYTLPALQS